MWYPMVVSQKQPAATSEAMLAPIKTLMSIPPVLGAFGCAIGSLA